MRSFWRLLSVCVLSVALPLKAWAFATMPCCELVAKAAMLSSVASQVELGPCHELPMEVLNAEHGGHSTTQEQHNVGMSCAVCMSGATTAVALPAVSPLPVTMFAGHTVHHGFVASNYINHVPDDVDRPPTSTLA